MCLLGKDQAVRCLSVWHVLHGGVKKWPLRMLATAHPTGLGSAHPGRTREGCPAFYGVGQPMRVDVAHPCNAAARRYVILGDLAAIRMQQHPWHVFASCASDDRSSRAAGRSQQHRAACGVLCAIDSSSRACISYSR